MDHPSLGSIADCRFFGAMVTIFQRRHGPTAKALMIPSAPSLIMLARYRPLIRFNGYIFVVHHPARELRKIPPEYGLRSSSGQLCDRDPFTTG
jgi:hypothetical protein